MLDMLSLEATSQVNHESVVLDLHRLVCVFTCVGCEYANCLTACSIAPLCGLIALQGYRITNLCTSS